MYALDCRLAAGAVVFCFTTAVGAEVSKEGVARADLLAGQQDERRSKHLHTHLGLIRWSKSSERGRAHRSRNKDKRFQPAFFAKSPPPKIKNQTPRE